jgi:Hermansky-Pudlak syndrome 5 protein
MLQNTLFQVRNGPTVAVHKILLLDTSIVQICSYEDYLLVSTNSKCVLCNTEKEEFKQVTGDFAKIITFG